MMKSITDELAASVGKLTFGPPVTHVYNPLEYARAPWDRYCAMYGQAPKEVLLVGLNPGPFGMAQVGVPFGEISAVRDWMGITGTVGRPASENSKRPVTGFACTRSEVSGQRLWGWAAARFGTPENFFSRFFVTNYCPLVFMEESGRNLTPDKLSAAERAALYAACDLALRQTVQYLQPRHVLGFGKVAAARIEIALHDMDVKVGHVLHPSPASPAANRGWAKQMDQALADYGII
jgi:single-strand selective monofunctional uracil DNA glycosylase